MVIVRNLTGKRLSKVHRRNCREQDRHVKRKSISYPLA